MKAKIITGGDHAGYSIKKHLIAWLEQEGYEVDDKGPFSEDSVDYPDFAHEVAKTVENDSNSLGLLVCGSANGVAMSANKHKGIRAALCWIPEIAKLAREHNNANIVCIPGRYVSPEVSESIMKAFLEASFEGGRHERRVNKIAD